MPKLCLYHIQKECVKNGSDYLFSTETQIESVNCFQKLISQIEINKEIVHLNEQLTQEDYKIS